MISRGFQILRFVKVATARQNVSWYYKFTADSLKGEHIDFVFMVSAEGELPSVIRDLILLAKDKKWWNVHLVELPNGVLSIQSIKEPQETQEELNEKSRLARLSITN